MSDQEEREILLNRELRESAKENKSSSIYIVIVICTIMLCALCNGSIVVEIIVLCLGAFIYYYFVKQDRIKLMERKKEYQEKHVAYKEFIAREIINAESAGFLVSTRITDIGDEFALAVDTEHSQWLFIDSKTEQVFYYKFSDLLNYEMFMDGQTLISGNTGSALIGGILFGTVGAIAGASSGQKATQNCTELYIDISVNDVKNPRQRITFISTALSKDSNEFKYEATLAKDIAALFDFIRNDDKRTENIDLPLNLKDDIYVEIEKLYSLKNQGIISEDEFVAKKKHLLGL